MLVQSYVFLWFYRHIIRYKAECNQVAPDILYFCTCKKNHNKNIIMKDETKNILIITMSMDIIRNTTMSMAG